MSALKFLNKKSWHTSTIRNNEKVWLKEQEAAKEKVRIGELQKQLEEERKLEEVQRLEIESGRLDPAEVLKRRRLNWMYEHGPNSDSKATKAKEEKDRDDVLLGKKDMDLDKIAQEAEKAKGESAAYLVDAEAKLREDPLLQIEKSIRERPLTSVASNGLLASTSGLQSQRKASKYSADELAAKVARKEQRRQIREQRKLKREERALRKRGRSDSSVLESGNSRPAFSDKGREPQPRRERPSMEHSEGDADLPHRGDRDDRQDEKFGLHIPIGGTGVAVTKEFVPRSHEEDADRERAKTRFLERRSRPPLPRSDYGDAEERRRKLKEMRENAVRLDSERRKLVEEHVNEEEREAQDMEARSRKRQNPSLGLDQEEPATSFARATIARGSSAADRIRQRRAWATIDSNASY